MTAAKMTADRIVAAALGMSEQAIEVTLRGGGKVTLVASANLLTMDTADRQFVFGLVDAFRDYGGDSAAQGISQADGSDSSTSNDAPKSEPQIQQEVEQPANAPAGAPSVAPAFEVIPESEAPQPERIRLDTGEPVKSRPSARAGAAAAETVPTHFYTCLQCGYEASGPASLEAHGHIHAVPAPPPVSDTRAGRLSSNMTPEEESNWVAAMAAGVPVTDDGPSPIEVARRMPVERASETVGPPPDPDRVCEFCGRECGSEAALNIHKSLCEKRPMAKPKEGEHVHHWKMEPPNGPVIHGRCDCGATREDPASPAPIKTSAERLEEQKKRNQRPMVTCGQCGRSMSGTQALSSHMRGTHPEAVAS